MSWCLVKHRDNFTFTSPESVSQTYHTMQGHGFEECVPTCYHRSSHQKGTMYVCYILCGQKYDNQN